MIEKDRKFPQCYRIKFISLKTNTFSHLLDMNNFISF